MNEKISIFRKMKSTKLRISEFDQFRTPVALKNQPPFLWKTSTDFTLNFAFGGNKIQNSPIMEH